MLLLIYGVSGERRGRSIRGGERKRRRGRREGSVIKGDGYDQGKLYVP